MPQYLPETLTCCQAGSHRMVGSRGLMPTQQSGSMTDFKKDAPMTTPDNLL